MLNYVELEPQVLVGMPREGPIVEVALWCGFVLGTFNVRWLFVRWRVN